MGEVYDAMGNQTRLDISEHIKSEGKSTFAELKDIFSLNPNTLRFHLQKLKDAHLITQTRSRGPYIITDLGMEVLEAASGLRNSENLKRVISGTRLEDFQVET